MIGFILLLTLLRNINGQKLFGVQSNDGDRSSSFAGSMAFDRDRLRLYITGTTYGNFFGPGTESLKERSDCFFAILQLPTRPGDSKPVWLRRMLLGEPDVDEVCSSLHMFKPDEADEQRIIVAGHTESSSEKIDNSTEHGIVGLLADLTSFGEMRASFRMNAWPPWALVSSWRGEDLFVALLSDDSGHTIPRSTSMQSFKPSTTAGSNLSLTLQRLHRNQQSGIAQKSNRSRNSWTIPGEYYSEIWSQQLESVLWHNLAGMVSLADGRLILAGSRINPSLGFMALYDTLTSETIKVSMLRGGESSDTQILGLCHSLADETMVYVVGTTSAMELQQSHSEFHAVVETDYKAFIAKINVVGLDLVWVQYLSGMEKKNGISRIVAQGCSESPDGKLVYMAGTAQQDSIITTDSRRVVDGTFGGDDIFIAQLSTGDGGIHFARQIGTEQDDVLANQGGVVCDGNGNAILLGNTKGSLFRTKNETTKAFTNDIVLFSVDRQTGAYGPVDTSSATTTSQDDESVSPNPSQIDDVNAIVDVIPRIDASPELNVGESPEGHDSLDRHDIVYLASIALVANIAIVSWVLLLFIRRTQGAKQRLLEKKYSNLLAEFDHLDSTESQTGDHECDALYLQGDSISNDDTTMSDLNSVSERTVQSELSGLTLRALPSLQQYYQNQATFLQLYPVSETIREDRDFATSDEESVSSSDEDEDDASDMTEILVAGRSSVGSGHGP